MTKKKYLTNQQFLKELEQRLPEFTQEDFATLMKITVPYQEKVMKLIRDANPQVYSWIQEKSQQLEQQKTDKEIDQLKKSLEDKK